jgi:hypothetical protein
MIYLYLKTHKITGKKYFGKTVRNPFTYKGSGTYWKEHLRRYGNFVDTQIIFQTECKKELKDKAMYYSNLWNIVENNEFANYVPEMGDGGDTSNSPKYQEWLETVARNKNSEYNKMLSEKMKKNNPIFNPEVAKKVHNEETYRKIGLAHKGKTISEEQKKVLSEKAKMQWKKQKESGYEFSEEQRKKISEKAKERWKKRRESGELDSEEFKNKMRELQKLSILSKSK